VSGRIGFPGLPGDDARPTTLHPDELSGDAVSAQELGGALEAARALETAAVASPVRASADFTDRVMARLQAEPTPGAVGYLTPLRRFGLGGLVASLRQAWAVAARGSRSFGVRATALAYVLAVVLIGTSMTGLAAYGTAGALGLLDGPDASPSPTLPLESPGPMVEPSPTTEPSPSPSTEPTPEPSATESMEPAESDDHGGAGATPRESSDDDDAETPDPSKTPKPSETPDSTRTPSPSGSEDADDG
jgi:hypothetical protein